MSEWDRIEAGCRSTDLRGGIEARVADPLWMLARQWQVGEFVGDDAGSPVAMRTTYESVTMNGYAARGNPLGPMPEGPLEYRVEAAPPPLHGGARLATNARLFHRLRRMLRRRGHGDVADRLSELATDTTADDVVGLGPRGDAVVDLLRRRTADVYALAVATEAALRADLVPFGAERTDELVEIVVAWQATARAELPPDDGGAWITSELSHTFTVTAPTTETPVVFVARDHPGGHLDWYSFDVAAGSRAPLVADDELGTVVGLPTPVVYSGMPAARWWEFENAAVQFGDIAAEPTDLARMIVADFATVYSDDWFVVPLVLPVGSVSRVRSVEIVDTFEFPTTATPAALDDPRPPLGRTWSMFELHGDASVAAGMSPLLVLPPRVPASLHGPVLERVEFARDEGANLAWAIESEVEGPLGRAVPRREAWRASTPPPPPVARTGPADSEVRPSQRYRDATWRYRASVSTPPHWIPLVPVRITLDAPDIMLRRGRLQAWDLLERRLVGPKGELLEPHHPVTFREEEIPRSGLRVERRWQLARWHDGRLYRWQQRQAVPGHGERSSGLGWDLIDSQTAATEGTDRPGLDGQ